MQQLKAKLIIHPPVNVHILVRASSGQGRAHDREIHVWGVASLDAFARDSFSAISSYLLSERCSYQGEGLRAQVRAGKPPAPGRMGAPTR